MAADLLQKLRDIHVPEEPGWWPPAPGWWLLAVLVIAALVWLAWRGMQAHRRRRPLREARRLYAEIYRRYCQGELTQREYLDQSNELLKRVLIHALDEDPARRASGDAWLELLDAHSAPGTFTRGPGRSLGNARFHPGVEADVPAVHQRVERLLARPALQTGSTS